MPEDEKKEEKIRRVSVDLGKQSPPPEPVNVSPFPVGKIKEGLTTPPPEPVHISPFQTTTAQPKSLKEVQKSSEGQE